MKHDSDKLLIAIRAKCLDCSGNMRGEVERCKIQSCPLHQYRSVSAIGGTGATDTQIDGQICMFETKRKRKEAV